VEEIGLLFLRPFAICTWPSRPWRRKRSTRRAYSQALEEFLIWLGSEPGCAFDKAAVQRYRVELQTKGLASSSIDVRLSAIRRLALEAGDNALLDPQIAVGIARARGIKQCGVRLGNWLTKDQAEALLKLPDQGTIKGLRDRALLLLLIGAGLRRHELSSLDVKHLQQRDGRWVIADLVGKHGRIRSIPLLQSTVLAVARWRSVANVPDGALFRSLTRHGHVTPRRISPPGHLHDRQGVWRTYRLEHSATRS
jgi:site-specific recombinase XerC